MAKQKKKNSEKAIYANLALWLSGLSLIGVLIVAGLKAFEVAGFYTPSPTTDLIRWLYITGGGVLAGLALFALIDPNRIRVALSGRQAKYGSNAVVMTIAFVVALVYANILVFQNPVSPWDLTKEKANTLAPETKNVLENLPSTVKATAFFSSRYNQDTVRELLEKYRTNSKGKFEYEFIDPDRNPLAAQEAGITGDGKILLEMGDAHEIIPSPTESELTSGFIRLLNPEAEGIYFLSGEGEHPIDSSEQGAFTRVKEALENKNYSVNSLNLEAEKIPDDASVIVVAGPLTPLSAQAVGALKEYLNSGGALIVMENPVPLTSFGSKKDYLADYLSSDWGLTINNDIVIDTQSPTSPYNATAYQYSQHPITQNMGGVGVTFPYARSLSVSFDNTDLTVTDLIYTTDASWGEKDFESIQNNQPAYDPATETIGPMLLAATSENNSTGGRVMVIGNSGFAIDENFEFQGNGDLLVNSVDWGAAKENLIDLSSADATPRSFVPPGAIQRIIILAGSVCLLPLAIIIMGVSAWYSRRKQG